MLIWSIETGQFVQRLEGHKDKLKSTSFSADGYVLASKSYDGTIRFWRTDSWETITVLDEPTSKYWPPSVEFHPREPLLITLGNYDKVVRLWQIDLLSKKAEEGRRILKAQRRKNRELKATERILREWMIVYSQRLANPQAKRHVREGLLQRHLMMMASRRRIFTKTHNRRNLLDPDLTIRLNIHINSYYLNLRGSLDNLAWVLGYELSLQSNLDETNRKHQLFCHLFGKDFLSALEAHRPDLSRQLRDFAEWSVDLKSFRDPAAHRIPLYMVPGVQTDATAKQREELERRAVEAAQSHDWHEYAAMQYEIRNLAIYLPTMAVSEPGKLEAHFLDQLLKDQEIFLEITRMVLVALFSDSEKESK